MVSARIVRPSLGVSHPLTVRWAAPALAIVGFAWPSDTAAARQDFTPTAHLLALQNQVVPSEPNYMWSSVFGTPFSPTPDFDGDGNIWLRARVLEQTTQFRTNALARFDSATLTPELVLFGTPFTFPAPGYPPGTVFLGNMLIENVSAAGPGFAASSWLASGLPGFGGTVIYRTQPDGTHLPILDSGNVPGHPGSTFAQLPGARSFVIQISSTGAMSFGGRFVDAQQVEHIGLYRAEASGNVTRVVDSTMIVPTKPANVAFSRIDLATGVHPLEPNHPVLSESGHLLFRAMYEFGGFNFALLLRQRPDGSFESLGDSDAATAPPPGAPPGSRWDNFRNTERLHILPDGTAYFSGAVRDPDEQVRHGVYLARPGHDIERVHDWQQPVPGYPNASSQSVVRALAINSAGDAAYSAQFVDAGRNTIAVVLRDRFGAERLVLGSNRLPSDTRPGTTANLMTVESAAMTSGGDLLLSVRLSIGTTYRMVFWHDYDRNVTYNILQRGDRVDQQEIWDISLDFGASDGGNAYALGPGHSFPVNVRLPGPDGIPGTADDIWGLYLLDVCYADCDRQSGRGVLDIFDFLCYGNKFAMNDSYACDCDLTTGAGVCDIFDFLCFGNEFNAGCQ